MDFLNNKEIWLVYDAQENLFNKNLRFVEVD